MTLTRTLLIGVVFIGSAFAVLAFGNPQWKWSFMFQRYYLGKDLEKVSTESGKLNYWSEDGELNGHAVYENGEVIEYVYIDNHITTIDMIESTSTTMSKIGELISRKKYFSDPLADGPYILWVYEHDLCIGVVSLDGQGLDSLVTIFDANKSIDRRAEFGIPVE